MADDARSLPNTALLETSFLYGANATFVDSNVTVRVSGPAVTPGGPLQGQDIDSTLFGLAKRAYNATLYYEEGKFSARASVAIVSTSGAMRRPSKLADKVTCGVSKVDTPTMPTWTPLTSMRVDALTLGQASAADIEALGEEEQYVVLALRERPERLLNEGGRLLLLEPVVGVVGSGGGAAERGGDLGIFGPRVMVPEFILGVLATPIGERSRVFESSFGFHIVERR